MPSAVSLHVHGIRSLDKRLLLSGLLLILLALAFWTGSRYPALSDKAAMGAETPTAGIAFDEVLVLPEDASVGYTLLANAVNWAYTNKQGMTFGLLFAALVLMVLPLLARIAFKSRWANTVLGVVVGTPLGVCVNCATPIAQGIHASGARAETTLATLFSSPTMNVVVLTMTLALFPFYLFGLKVGLTLAFILFGIPLLLRWLPVETARMTQATVLDEGLTSSALLPRGLSFTQEPPPSSWLRAAGWVVPAFGRSLWYIVRTTLPLMLLAGVLGAVAITLLPWASLMGWLPQSGAVPMLTAMVGLAVLGTFLPVPIAFDVILCAILWSAGVPVEYVVVLLVTLGVFSVYPFMVLWREMSRKVAVALFLAVAGLGVVAGVAAHYAGEWHETRQRHLVFEHLLQHSEPVSHPALPPLAETPETLLPRLASHARPSTPMRVSAPEGIQVAQRPFLPNSAPGQGFSRLDGVLLGLEEPAQLSLYRTLLGISENRGIASGDIHGDGWPDLVMTSEVGLTLYANENGERFIRQAIEVPLFDSLYVTRAALVDVTGDGALDLYVSTFYGGSYLVVNEGGRFRQRGLQQLPNVEGAIHASAVAFGDVDRDGDLDIILGNEVGANKGAHQSFPEGQNVLLINGPTGFTQAALPGFSGETLSVLLSDLDGDDDLDLVMGNDFAPSDVCAYGDGRGHFAMIHRADGIIPYTTLTTMSVTSADLDNDLVPEILHAENSRGDRGKQRFEPTVICAEFAVDSVRAACEKTLEIHNVEFAARQTADARRCWATPEGPGRDFCVARLAYYYGGKNRDDTGLCDLLDSAWPYAALQCRRETLTSPPRLSESAWATTIPQRHTDQANVLLTRAPDGRYTDRAESMGVMNSGWSWNATFADVDHDTWQDLFVVSGFLYNNGTDPSAFFRNESGTGFSEATESFGLASSLDVQAYTYVDFDQDGDLDIVMPSALGPVVVYRNEVNDGRSIAFELRDEQGNRFGIGSKVVIHYGQGGRLHQLREIRASGGFASYDAPVAHFGLGAHSRVERVEVVWSTGERTEISGDFRAGMQYVLTRAAL